ncbi:hypothetical protein LQ948_00905 [Jiella sp. MQZ9-1]|uniref:Uncharacterized protein n=1 Tax=Jiella flava TaxID=2816857 RepID=A0A939FVV6_9HYPH|nr:hypothetical protein [Jiella flava]MBO0661120.1 hypothetical protein [Jiella flava]MCD2469766.1 hypothetical protein [Jiella flava]
MYETLIKAHGGLAMLAVLLSLGWTGVALAGPSGAAGMVTGIRKVVYIGAVAVTSLVGLLGLVLVGLRPDWAGSAFTWIGLATLVFYPILGARSRRAHAAGQKGAAIGLSVAMLLLLLVTYWVMMAKPF